MHKLIFVYLIIFLFSCKQRVASNQLPSKQVNKSLPAISYFDTEVKTIHVFVALCDNKYQGIVPVPARIGNGQDVNSNLYWGCSMGIRTYFKNSKNWTLVRKYAIDSLKLERIIFKNNFSNYYLVADAYNGKNIRECTIDFFRSASGQQKDTIHIPRKTIGINGNAKLLAYIGHDGLMDFNLTEKFNSKDDVSRDVIILACISKRFFSPHLINTKANPLVWTTGLMCPEAYTLHDAIEGYIKNEPAEKIRTRAAKAYSKYQKCSEKAARNLLATGY